MERVVVISTGGTISMVQGAEMRGAAPQLGGEDLLSGLGADLAEVEIVELLKVPSAHFTVEDLWTIRENVAKHTSRNDVAGVVVSQGTDVLEEVAYLLDITVPGETPVVVTGAMRTASHAGWEGDSNLLASISVAADAKARGLGALVVLNDEIHAARYVTKMHTQAVGTFRSPGWGPLGRVDGDEVIIGWRVEPQDVIDCQALEPNVPLIKLVVGIDEGLLGCALRAGAQGVVLEILGGGRVPPWWMPAIREASEEDVPIVVTSRCPSGRVYDSYRFEGSYRDLVDANVSFTWDLNGPKARIRLMAALNAASRLDVSVEDFFDRRVS